MNGIDLSKIKSEISSRKQQDIEIGEHNGRIPKNKLIHGLLNARDTGKPNEASQAIRAVSMVSEGKKATVDEFGNTKIIGSSPMNLPPIPSKPQNSINEMINYPKQSNTNSGMMTEREPVNNLNSELVRRTNEYASQGIKTDAWGIPLQSQQPAYQQQYNPQMMGGVNADALQGLVFELMDKYLQDKMVPLMKEALKSTIVDQYTNSVVKNNIVQNEEAIEEILKKLIKKMGQSKK